MLKALNEWAGRWLTRTLTFTLLLTSVVVATGWVIQALEVFGVVTLGAAALFTGRGWYQPWTGHADG